MSVKDIELLPASMKKSPYGEGIKGHDLQMIHPVKQMQGPARLACALIERWGLVAGEIDGEDSAGRSKLRRLTPAELVRDACDTADAAYDEFENRGWFLRYPATGSDREQGRGRRVTVANREVSSELDSDPYLMVCR